MTTLKEFLLTQDMGDKAANTICEKVILTEDFDANNDPISAIIVNAFQSNAEANHDNMLRDYDFSNMENDLSYAIKQLQKALDLAKKSTIQESIYSNLR